MNKKIKKTTKKIIIKKIQDEKTVQETFRIAINIKNLFLYN